MLLTFVGYAKNKSQNNEIYVGYTSSQVQLKQRM